MKMYRPHRLCPRNSKPKEPSLYRSLCVSILCMFLSTVMLVGTTFAWFHSSATSAVSTITAASQFKTTQAISQDTIRLAVNSASAVALYDSDNASETDISLDDLPWSPFTSNSGSPFSSVPFSPGDSQVIFLRLDNTGSSDSTYRLALNLLSEAPGKTADGQEVSVREKLVYGYEVLDAADLFELASFNPADRTNLDDTVTTNFVADPLSAHSGERNEDIITYGGNICSVTLSAGTVKYVAIALYMPENVELPNFVALPTIAVQLAMTVEQASTTEPQQPNVVISPISNSTVVEIKQAVIEQPKEEVVAASVDDAAKPSESTGDNATADQQPAPGGTETPASPDPSSGSTTGTEGTTGTSESGDTGTAGTSDTSGGGDTTVTENGSET